MIYTPDSSTLNLMGQFYTSFSNGIINSIENTDAGFIWVYLQTQANNFKVRATHLKERFSLGETRYLRAMKYLKDLDLIKYELVRNKEGHIIDNIIHCFGLPHTMIDEFKSNLDSFKEKAKNLKDKNDPVDNSSESTGNPENKVAGEKNTKNSFIPLFNKALTGNPVFTGTGEKPETGKTGLVNKESNILNLTIEKSYPQPQEIHSTAIGRICRNLVSKGIRCNHANPTLIALIKAGINEEEFAAAAEIAFERKKLKLGYVLTVVESIRREAEEIGERIKNNPLPNKKINAKNAYLEALEQSRKREEGLDVWSHPAIFWAYKAVGGDLQRSTEREVWGRWVKALDDAETGLKNGSLSETIPPFVKKMKVECENVEASAKPAEATINELRKRYNLKIS